MGLALGLGMSQKKRSNEGGKVKDTGGARIQTAECEVKRRLRKGKVKISGRRDRGK